MADKTNEKRIGDRTIRLVKGDITTLEVEAFVFYASHDLKLGTGFGGAIAVRGGPTIQQQLDAVGRRAETTESVVTDGGNLKAKYIIHAVGPRFQEQDLERKLRETVKGVLRTAEDNGIARLAFPAMGCGFYGVPLELSARVMFDTISGHLAGATQLNEVLVCLNDNRELNPFAAQLAALA